MTWNKHTHNAVCFESNATGREQVSWQPMCRTACDEVSVVPTVLTVTNLCQTLGLRSVHMKSSSVTFTSNDVLSDSHNLGRCHPSYALLSCFGLPYIIMADEVMIQNILAKCDSHTKGQKLLSVVFRPTVLRLPWLPAVRRCSATRPTMAGWAGRASVSCLASFFVCGLACTSQRFVCGLACTSQRAN